MKSEIGTILHAVENRDISTLLDVAQQKIESSLKVVDANSFTSELRSAAHDLSEAIALMQYALTRISEIPGGVSMDENLLKIGALALAKREELGLSHAKLSETTGLSNNTICSIEKPKLGYKPRLETLEKLERGLSIKSGTLSNLLRDGREQNVGPATEH